MVKSFQNAGEQGQIPVLIQVGVLREKLKKLDLSKVYGEPSPSEAGVFMVKTFIAVYFWDSKRFIKFFY